MKHILTVLAATLLAACSGSSTESDAPKTDHEKKAYITDIGYSGKPGNAAKLVPFLSDPSPDVVGTASFYIGYLKSREHIPELAKLLNHQNPKIINMAAGGLSNMVTPSDVHLLDPLNSILSNSDLLARMSAIEAIGNIGSKESASALELIFENEEPAAKWQIISALGKIGNQSSLPLLNKYLETVNAMDHSVPKRGGARGSVPHPSSLKTALEQSIALINRDV